MSLLEGSESNATASQAEDGWDAPPEGVFDGDALQLLGVDRRRTPPEARAVGHAVELVLAGMVDLDPSVRAGAPPAPGVGLRRLVEGDPTACLQAIQEVDAAAMPNPLAQMLADLFSTDSCLSRGALDDLYNARKPWARPLAVLAFAVADLLLRVYSCPGRLSMRPRTVVVFVDGSRVSFQALEIAARLKRHGKLVVAHVDDGCEAERPLDLRSAFLVEDLQHRCEVVLRMPRGQFEVVACPAVDDAEEAAEAAAADGGLDAAVQRAMATVVAEHEADLVVVGCFGESGPRVGTLGKHAVWAVSTLHQHVCIANPYSPTLTDPTKPAAGGVLWLLAVKPNLPEPADVVAQALCYVAWYDQITVLVLLPDAPNDAPANEQAVDRINAVLEPAGVRSSVKLQPHVPAKTPEQLILHACETDRADFLLLDRGDDWHPECLKNGRATTVMLPAERLGKNRDRRVRSTSNEMPGRLSMDGDMVQASRQQPARMSLPASRKVSRGHSS